MPVTEVSVEDLEHDGEENECPQNAADAGCEENQESVKDSVSEPALEL